jgi:S-DNA-T family DNA segregation ATPase FtsK/SpoIIIE
VPTKQGPAQARKTSPNRTRPVHGSWKKKKPNEVDNPLVRMRKQAKAKAKKRREENVHELVGVGLVLVALLAGFGLLGAAGPLGDGLAWLLRGALGWVGFAVPPALGWVGWLTFRHRGNEAGQRALGMLVFLLAVAAFGHLLLAEEPPTLDLDRLVGLTGVLGAGLAWPLESLLSAWGAGLFILALGLMGALIATKTSLAQASAFARRGLQASAGMAAGAGRSVRTVALPLGRRIWQSRAVQRTLERLSPRAEEADGSRGKAAVSGSSIREALSPPPAPAPSGGIGSGAAPAAGGGLEADSALGASPAAVGSGGRPGGQPGSSGYQTPPLSLLSVSRAHSTSAEAIRQTQNKLSEVLKQFDVGARVTGHAAGPTFTRYEIELDEGVKVSRVVGLEKEIRYHLASGEVRILAPIPGRSAIGIEVPNRNRHFVTLGDVLRSERMSGMTHPLMVGLGSDMGLPVGINLAEMPHLLIAGATGGGKSSCINAMLISILMRTVPEQVRLLLIDPKRVELSHYNGVPHLLAPVVTAPRKAAEALNWLVREMEARYEVLEAAGMRHVDLYNEAVRAGALSDVFDDGVAPTPYPYYLLVIDELADLMMVAPREVEEAICRIAQMARAVGIHMVVATQRPSVDVVTGVIKANIPSRLAFTTASAADSRVILDEGGAERMIGHGDMLYRHASAPRPLRLQGAWVTEREILEVIAWWRRQRPAEYLDGIVSTGGPVGGELGGGDDDEELLGQALELVVRSQLGSTSMLQRKLKVGFARAGRLMDLLEQRGVVGPSLGSKPRDVLMSIEELGEARSPAPEDL